MTVADQAAIGFAGEHDYRRARDVFFEAGYDEAGLRQALNCPSNLTPTNVDLARLLYCTSAPNRLNTLIRTFILGASVAAEDLSESLRPMDLATWERAGLIAVAGTTASSRVRLVPVRGLLVASDPVTELRTAGRGDFVMGIGKCTELLSSMLITRQSERTLDLGTGCGWLALLASRYSGHVWATDINPRAVMYAKFNAALNGVPNVTCRCGNLLEPVSGQRFEAIITNPPYVISPDHRFTFCQSGMRGDHFCRNLARHLSDYLTEGGFCQMVCNWASEPGMSWSDSIARWFDGIPCDVLVWGGGTESAEHYVRSWMNDIKQNLDESESQHYGRWLRYLEEENIGEISYGIITMRRRTTGGNYVQVEPSADEFSRDVGHIIEQRFSANDFLRQLATPEEILNERFRAAEGLRIGQEYEVTPAGLNLAETKLRMTRGFITSSLTDPQVTSLVARCDGQRTLREIFQEIAAAMEVDLQAVAAGGNELARRLVERGWLVPVRMVDSR